MTIDPDTFVARYPDGRRVTLIKRAMAPAATVADTLRAWPNSNTFNAVLARMEAEELAKADHDEADGGDRNTGGDGGGIAEHPVARLAGLLVASGKFSDHAQALDHLLNTPRGAALVRTHKAKDPPMDTVLSIMKSAGIAATCAVIVSKGHTTITESELVEAATAVAAERHPNMSPAQAFDKVYSDRGEEGQALRKAVAIAKAMPFMPTMVGGVDATHEAIDSTESSAAYEQLTRMAEKMREASPELSAAQAFDRVFTDKRNASLAAKAHVRPSPTTFFPMPR
jgi:hypothetical protein